MKNVKLLFVIYFLSFCSIAFAQRNTDQIKKVGARYLYQKRMYDKNDLTFLLEKDSMASELNRRSEMIRGKAKIAGITTLSLLVIGAGSFVIGNNSDRCSFFSRRTCVAYIVGPIALTTGLLSIPVTIAMFGDAKGKRNRSVRIFNKNLEAHRDFGQAPVELNLKINADRFGLVLNF